VEGSQAALRYLKAMPVSLLIADDVLPEGQGSTLLERVQVAAPFAVRLLALDRDAPADVAIDALNRGRAAWILRKPMEDPLAVSGILRRALTSYELEAQSRAAVETLQLVVQGKSTVANDRALQIERLCTAGEMAGSLIHRFNNTLSIIIGHLELLVLDADSDEIESRLEPVFQSVNDSAELARHLQEFMRSSPVNRELLDLNELVHDTVRMTEPVWKSGSRLDGTVDLVSTLSDVPPVSGNPAEIREVLTNLVLNAVDAMPRGGTLTVTTEEADGWVRVAVADTGAGMSSDIQERIFEPFFTTKGRKGNGLGLCIVRRIVREHGGDIRIESDQGHGSRFVVMLPDASQAAPAREEPGYATASAAV
jgi:signal transduction histidine kinase